MAVLCAAALAATTFAATQQSAVKTSAKRNVADVAWATSWGSAQLQPYGNKVLPAGTLDGATLRQVVHLSVGVTQLRLRLSNAFGQEPLQV